MHMADEKDEGSQFSADKVTIEKLCQVELDQYLATAGIKLMSNVEGSKKKDYNDPLSWWKERDECGQFPTLCRLAELFLAIPATSAPSERILSRGWVFGPKGKDWEPFFKISGDSFTATNVQHGQFKTKFD